MTTIHFELPDWFLYIIVAMMLINALLSLAQAYLKRKIRLLTIEQNGLIKQVIFAAKSMEKPDAQ